MSLHRRRFFRRSGKRKRDHCDRGNRERRWQWRRRRWVTEERRGEERRGEARHKQRNLTRCGSDTLASDSQEISSGNLRRGTPARRDLLPRDPGKLGTSPRSSCVRSYMCVVARRSSACTCEAQRYEGYFSNGISGGSEGSRGSIDRRPIVGADQRRGNVAGRKCEPYSISAVRLLRYFYRAQAETCY